MKSEEALDIIECLPKGRTIFYYFKDRYTVELLSIFVGTGKPIREIRESSFGKLLNRPMTKELCSRLGNKQLTAADLKSVWPAQPEAYLLTLGLWGKKTHSRWMGQSYFQTSRPGTNIVLQLNFSTRHDRPYAELIRPKEAHPFEYALHPINKAGRHTLGWARLDVDMANGEALIEEIQSDWVRLALEKKTTVEEIVGQDRRQRVIQERVIQREFRGTACDRKSLDRYVKDILQPHISIWDEAILCATIWFLDTELGIRRIFYHTFDSGSRLKRISGKQPPRSLYTTLPKRFCFQETEDYPVFLERYLRTKLSRARKLSKPPRFFLLQL